jgi:hypothetical protein
MVIPKTESTLRNLFCLIADSETRTVSDIKIPGFNDGFFSILGIQRYSIQ